MKLSAWMIREGVSDQQLAEKVGRDRTTVLRIRQGTHKPSPELMEAIALVTDGAVRPDDYFDGLPEDEAA